MIINKDGRTRSVRTPEENLELLKSEIEQLSQEERETLMLALRELDDPAIRGLEDAAENGGPTRIIDALNEGEYARPLVDLETFCKDEYYLGATCRAIYPKLLEDLEEIFAGSYREIILTGGIGVGKSFTASVAICRVLYELSCMRDIHRTVGLAPGSGIVIAGISVNEQLAIKVVYENIATKIAQSPYFNENFPFEETKKELRFPNKVSVNALSTTDTSALGLNIIGLFMDEGNFYEAINRGKAAQQKYGDKDKARVLYDQMTRRMKSRFMKNGKMPGLAAIVSSKRTKDDFTAKRIAEAARDPSVFVMDYALWDLVPERYGKERFQVLVGNETLPSRILKPEEVEATRKKIEELGDDSLIIVDIPLDFKEDFINDLDGSIRDTAGIATVSVSPFISQRDKIELCIEKGDPAKGERVRQHPFQIDEWDQSRSAPWIWERIAHKTQIRDGAEVFDGWQPIFYPGHPRHIHIDPSLNTDYTGFCVGCIAGYAQVQRRNQETQELYVENAPIIWIDMMLRIKPPLGGEIDHGQVRGLVYQLQTHGFPISLITMDQFNSAASLQKFATKGIEAERLSVDKPMDAYDTLKSALYEGRIRMYRYEPVLDELRKLQKDNVKRKVDHVRGGRKDVADALAGVTFSLTTRAHHAPMMPLRGLSASPDPDVNYEQEIAATDDLMIPFMLG